MDLLLSPSGGVPSRCPVAPPAETAPGSRCSRRRLLSTNQRSAGAPWRPGSHPHLLHKLMSPFSVLMRTRALPAPSRNRNRGPGVLVGPLGLRPETVADLAVEARHVVSARLADEVRRTSPLMLSRSSRASDVSFALTSDRHWCCATRTGGLTEIEVEVPLRIAIDLAGGVLHLCVTAHGGDRNHRRPHGR